MALNDKNVFIADPGPLSDPGDKNDVLIKALQGRQHDLAIVQIERIEIAVQGWRITYRPSPTS